MFGSSNPFGQASGSSPFGTQTQSGFGQSNNTSNNNPFAQKPFDTSTPFGVQTGSSMFGGTSTGVFGAPQISSPFGASSQAFGNSTLAFGASSTSAFGNSASTFGGSSTFGQISFGLSTPQANPFGSTTQQSQPEFGIYTFGNSNTPAFGASSNSAFGASSTSAFGASSTSAFGAINTPAFGATSTPGFGATSTTGLIGASSTSAFGSTNTPAFGASSSPAFGASPTPAFVSSGTAFGSGGCFGASSTPAFGASSSPSLNFGSSPAFGQSTSAFGSTSFGSTQSSFGVQDSKSMFGCQSTIRGQEGGSRVMPYPHTNLSRKKRKMILNLNLKKSNPGPQNVNKGKSHTSMPPPSPQIPLQNFSEGDVPRKDQKNSNIPGGNKRPRRDESSSSKSALADVSFADDTHKRRMVIAESFREFTSNGEKPLPSFDEWDPHARDLYVRNSIQQAKVAAGFNDTVRLYESALKRRVPLEDFAAVEKRISDLQMKIKSDASLIGLVDQLKKERDNALDSLKLSQEKINVLVHELNAMQASSREFDELKRKYDALLKSSEADRERSTDENRCDVRSHCRGLIKEIANHFDSLKASTQLQSDVHELSTNQSLLAHFEKKDFNLVKEEKEVNNSLAEAEAQLRSIPYSDPDLEKNNSVFDELLSFEDPLGVPPKATQGQTSSRIVEESQPFPEEGLPNDKNSARASSSHP